MPSMIDRISLCCSRMVLIQLLVSVSGWTRVFNRWISKMVSRDFSSRRSRLVISVRYSIRLARPRRL
jgi:hypothetical protein